MESDSKISFSQELLRKSIHLSMLAIPFLALRFGKMPLLYVMIPLAVTALAADYLRSINSNFASFIGGFFGKMLRAEESDGSFSINGATWVLCSFSLILAVFPIQIAAASIGLFVLGDAFAALVGRRIGRHKIAGGSKSIEGSIAFLVFGALILPFIPNLPWTSKLLGLIVGMLAEIPDGPMNDNLRVPLAAAFVMLLLQFL